jgi:hypothetical protein
MIVLSAVALAGCPASPSSAARVTSRKIAPWGSVVNPHLDKIGVVTIDGTEYRNVRGWNDLYVQIDNSPFVFFVVNEKDYRANGMLYNLNTRRMSSFDIGVNSFGNYLGVKSGPSRDEIEIDRGGNVVLVSTTRSEMGTMIERRCFDPNTGAKMYEQTSSLDNSGKK